jgi:hypothetical protein
LVSETFSGSWELPQIVELLRGLVSGVTLALAMYRGLHVLSVEMSRN